MRTKIINDQLTDLFYNFIEMEDRIAANDRYADLNSSDMRFLSAVGKGSHPRTITQVGDYLRVGRQTAHHASSSRKLFICASRPIIPSISCSEKFFVMPFTLLRIWFR